MNEDIVERKLNAVTFPDEVRGEGLILARIKVRGMNLNLLARIILVTAPQEECFYFEYQLPRDLVSDAWLKR